MSRFTDFFWPTLERPTLQAQRAQNEILENDVNELAQTTWTKVSEEALREARNISEREDERRRSTDTKASNYLLVIAALIPLLTYLESTVWEQKVGTAPEWLSLLILGIAVVHILWAGHWAFKTLTVQAFHAMDGTDLIKIWSDADPVQSLVRETLITTRRNRDAINEKVSSIKMAHIFLKKGIYWFGFLLLAQVIWYQANFTTAATASNSAVVVLNSQGGATLSALEMGKTIRLNRPLTKSSSADSV